MDKKSKVKLDVYEAHDKANISFYERECLFQILNGVVTNVITESEIEGDVLLKELYNSAFDVLESSLDRKVTSNLRVMNFGVYGNGATDRGFGYDPYFKIFDGPDPRKSKNLVRISFFRPEYIIHEHQVWNLKPAEKDLLIKYLKSYYRSDTNTLWDQLIDEAEKELSNLKSHKDYNKWIDNLEAARNNMPDYTKLAPIK